jgi:choloylglycine hydrolase
MSKIFTTIIAVTLWVSSGFACSAFFWVKDKMIFGKNLDWYNGEGYILKNNSGITKYAYSISKAKPASWTSKYGSFTFNQIGKEFPYGGINEKGLVVEQLWLHASAYQDNKNETISELEWIQYQLDNYENIDQVIQNINTLTIKPIKATVHYFIADSAGKSAAIDFISGKVIINYKNGISQTLTNTGYQASCKYYNSNVAAIDTSSRLSEDRFCQVAENLKKYSPESYQEAFSVLALSAENKKNYKTFWTIIYDISTLEIHFKSYTNPLVKSLKLSDFDFGQNTAVIGCNINTDELVLKPYTYELNKTLLTASLKAMNINADIETAAAHQFNPSKTSLDTTYLNTYCIVKITFILKKNNGNLYYTIAEGEQNFNKRRGVISNLIAVDTNIVYSEVYTVKKGEYGIAAFHDINANRKLDRGLFGIPNEPYAFSKNKKGLFGFPPKYRHIKVLLTDDTDFIIKF